MQLFEENVVVVKNLIDAGDENVACNWQVRSEASPELYVKSDVVNDNDFRVTDVRDGKKYIREAPKIIGKLTP